MATIVSVQSVNLPYKVTQEEVMTFAKHQFSSHFKDIDRLLPVFENGGIQTRYLVSPLEWFTEVRSFQEKNDCYIQNAVKFGCEAMDRCLASSPFLQRAVSYDEIDALFFISSTGISAPSIEARWMNERSFSPHTKRIPIWGLGCAGGASGLSRAYDYCKAFPRANVLVVAVEFCSLTFQQEDGSKSNFIGTSLFGDGVACVLLCGDASALLKERTSKSVPVIKDVQTTLMPHSEDVMGWDVKNEGLYVVFSRDIPTIVSQWLQPTVAEFLEKRTIRFSEIDHWIAHPGGQKVLTAYEAALGLTSTQLQSAQDVLRTNGNMSSATILYVLQRVVNQAQKQGDKGIMMALGPGFSAELVLVEWA
ncbi:terpene family molecule synthase [Fictibacillus macauensis ZFHKF-1]|uniref:Terpene family molecule synthase n=1 Tax=Fictibacillus macauensis ZFHKF-1 TaxID=1196324 RepID=I8ALM5_9BACL|nr:3-oxoacyl-[acyl-carrier-protein] synthase III C-terminal domain-containing protein [Fictibacillus macauensis]EIT86514.1 terpene family molecule synthase [Fictibacillus macauensis ZFHKF-1]